MRSNIISSRHEHKFYFTTSKMEFEPIDPSKYEESDLYKRVEYAVLMCNSPCNEVKKVPVKKEFRLEDE